MNGRLELDAPAQLPQPEPDRRHPGSTDATDPFVVAATAWPNEAADIGERLMVTLTQPLQVGGAEIIVSASLGMAQWDGAGTADALMRDADTAMYRAKTEGRRRRVVFDPSMRRQVRERVELEQALTRALGRDELRLAYQPIARLSDGAVVAAEALMRWDHPQRGGISPSTFIPIAEEAGLIAEMGDWALRQVLYAAAAWRRAGLVVDDFWMSVNVSPQQLRDDIRRALRLGAGAGVGYRSKSEGCLYRLASAGGAVRR